MQGQTPKSLPRVLPSKRTGEMCAYNTRPQVAPSRMSLQWPVIQYKSRDMAGLILPFDQFAFAELKREGKQQDLRLVFATHEIAFRGPRVAPNRDRYATNGTVIARRVARQSAVTRSRRPVGGTRNFRHGDPMRWYAFPCFSRMTNVSAANVSKRGIPPCERAFYCENDGC